MGDKYHHIYNTQLGFKNSIFEIFVAVFSYYLQELCC